MLADVPLRFARHVLHQDAELAVGRGRERPTDVRRLARDLFSKPLDYTAIFASTDSNALGILKAADEMHIDIPDRLSLIGFDNITATGMPRIELTTIDRTSGAGGSYFYRGAWSNIDHCLVGGAFRAASSQIFVRDYLLESPAPGLYKPRRTFLGTVWHGGLSDHLPVLTTLQF